MKILIYILQLTDTLRNTVKNCSSAVYAYCYVSVDAASFRVPLIGLGLSIGKPATNIFGTLFSVKTVFRSKRCDTRPIFKAVRKVKRTIYVILVTKWCIRTQRADRYGKKAKCN